MSSTIAKVWKFASSSGGSTYETLLMSNGSKSCNCPGWTRRVAADGSRSCKHTRLVDMSRADQECISSHDYGVKVQVNISIRANVPITTNQLRPGQRKLDV